MVLKKSLMFFFCIIFLSSLVIAQEYRIEISIISEDKIFEPGQIIKLIATLYDSNNKIIEDDVLIIIKDLKEEIIQKETIKSKDIVEIKLNENALAGNTEITAEYKDAEAAESFFVSKNELAKFELNGEKLIVTNIGNTKYEKRIHIVIGGTTGTKIPNLKIGESISYRLIAPEGVYTIKVSDGVSQPLERGKVKLTGTGKVIGALNEQESQVSGITGISPEKNSEGELLNYIKNSKFVYVFILTIFGAMILLAVERRYRKKVGQ